MRVVWRRRERGREDLVEERRRKTLERLARFPSTPTKKPRPLPMNKSTSKYVRKVCLEIPRTGGVRNDAICER